MKDLYIGIASALENEYRDKYVDEDFMQELFTELKTRYGLEEELVGGFVWGGESPDILGSGGYSNSDKKIQFFKRSINWAKNEVRGGFRNLTDEKEILAVNLSMIATMFHEIDHARQVKVRNNEDTLEAFLLRKTNDQEETISSYDTSPEERFAESRAIDAILEVMKVASFYEPEMEQYFVKRKYHALAIGYFNYKYPHEENMYPIKSYSLFHGLAHSEIGLEESLETFPSMETRLYYGYPLTHQELVSVREKAGIYVDSEGFVRSK